MSKTIRKVVVVLGTLVVVALLWTFVFGPKGVARDVGGKLAGKVDTIFNQIGLTTDFQGAYEAGFEKSTGKEGMVVDY